MSRHPIIGQEYEVQSDIDHGAFDTDTLVPIGEDEYGNLRVEHFNGTESKVLVWTEANFRESVSTGGLVEA